MRAANRKSRRGRELWRDVALEQVRKDKAILKRERIEMHITECGYGWMAKLGWKNDGRSFSEAEDLSVGRVFA